MDTSKVKALAIGAREELRREVGGRLDAVLTEGSPERLLDPQAVHELEATVAERGRDQVVDGTAYTWFNRLCALRFMDANGYNPTPVVTPRESSTLPAILADAAQGVFDPAYGIDRMARDRVAALLLGSVSSANATEDAYATLLRAVCRHYEKAMGYLFSEESASPLLMPRGLLAEGSILRRIVEDMDAEACSSVEVLGWLYQFYIAERKDEYFKSKRKARPDDIAPATQLFTPEYIVRFLTQNSLGRLWMLNNPGSGLAGRMEYYIAPKGDEPHVDIDGAEDIRVLDPACGSGHILVYAFDLLFSMYEEEGYNPEDIPALILGKNLRGLEIDPRAAEIAKFALEMKAREHDPRFLERDVDADVTVLSPVELEHQELSQTSGTLRERTALLDAMAHMGEAGSLYVPNAGDAEAIRHELVRLGDPHDDDMFRGLLRRKLGTMLANVEALSGAYHCVIANPPYMGSGNMGPWLSAWVKENYPDEKGDLCTCFIKRGLGMTVEGGYSAEVTMQSWMFLGSYEKMRRDIIENHGIAAMAHIGARGFDAIGGEVVSTTATVFERGKRQRPGTYVRVVETIGEDAKASKIRDAVSDPTCPWRYDSDAKSFKSIPGWPIGYAAGNSLISIFEHCEPFDRSLAMREGIHTADNDRFLRLWWEIADGKIVFNASSVQDVDSMGRWVPYIKGGNYRKWYGNLSNVIGFDSEMRSQMRRLPGCVWPSKSLWFKEGGTWTAVSQSNLGVRLMPRGCLFDAGGQVLVGDNYLEAIAALNTSLYKRIAELTMPTMNFKCGVIKTLPDLRTGNNRVISLAKKNISFCRTDWDAFETSWDFESHPLAQPGEPLVERQFERWQLECQSRFDELKANEEELNRIFVHIYHMEGEVPIEVPDDKVSVRRADLARDVRSLVSYGVGCILGRYSLDTPGLVLVDQGSTVADYLAKVPDPTLMPDADNILPITDAAWFEDDVVDSFYRFLAAAYGEDSLGDNVAFIEGALGCDLRTYFSRHFYADHLKTYQKRPIYWLFQSPKKTFSCLVYMHRYDESTVGEILTSYLRPLQGKLRSRIELLEKSESARDAREANRLRAQVQELADWERDVVYPLAHERVSIDLDDGVKVNYNKFPHALAKVPGLSNWK
jgi:hypothetical protein